MSLPIWPEMAALNPKEDVSEATGLRINYIGKCKSAAVKNLREVCLGTLWGK